MKNALTHENSHVTTVLCSYLPNCELISIFCLQNPNTTKNYLVSTQQRKLYKRVNLSLRQINQSERFFVKQSFIQIMNTVVKSPVPDKFPVFSFVAKCKKNVKGESSAPGRRFTDII